MCELRPLCNFISLSLKRWIFSRQSPRPFSCSHLFRRLRDIYRNLTRKTDQKTIPPPFVGLVIKFVCLHGHSTILWIWDPTCFDIVVVGWTLDPSDLGYKIQHPLILLWCENILQHSFSSMMDTRSIGPWIEIQHPLILLWLDGHFDPSDLG